MNKNDVHGAGLTGKSAAAWGWPQRLALVMLWSFLLSPLVMQTWVTHGRQVQDRLFLFNLGTSLLWISFSYFSVSRQNILHLVLLPLYLTTAIDLFLSNTFRSRLSSGYVGIALTDYGDIGEFLGLYCWPASISLLVLLAIYVPALRCLSRACKSRAPRRMTLVACLLLAAYGLAIGVSMKRNGTGFWQAVPDVAAHESSAPVGVLFQSALALKLHADNAEVRAHRAGYTFGATKAPSIEDEIYVLVVGESARPANWSLFGYARDTSPRLAAMQGILRFPNMLTTAPHTSVAVPSMLSLQSITDWPAILAQRSIVGAFNETGFKTFWLSTQDADSWAGVIPQVAAEAARRVYIDRGFDGALLDDFRQILHDARRGSKLFIVLHTKGSHFEYRRRYPSQFARFTSQGGARRDRLIDEYDNSILYTDWVLGELISMLAERNGRSALFYASDHGENLLDDDRQLLGHAIGTQYDLQTASFLWLSPALSERAAEQLRNAKRHATYPLSLSNLPHSLLDLAGISAPELDRTMSIFSPRFRPHARAYRVRGELRYEQVVAPAAAH